MKHIFVINPKAGKDNKVDEISNALKEIENIDYEIYVTKSRGDAKTFVREFLESHDANIVYRFYACGGDGTLHDVVNGAYGFKNAEIACYACGSGNDFIKNYKDRISSFSDLRKIIYGTPKDIDLLDVDGDACINILNVGFDGEVTFCMHKLRKLPLIKGPLAYNLAAISSLLFKMSCFMKVMADDELVYEGKSLLAVCANGYCYGGGFYCAPKAEIDDGLIDLCFIKKVSRFKAAGLMKVYKTGKHLEDPKLAPLLIYKKCNRIVIEGNKPIAYAIDGEIYRKEKFEVKIVPKALKFVVPTL